MFSSKAKFTRVANRFAKACYSTHPYQHIIISKPASGVRLITLNRPKALNALFSPLINELNDALVQADKDNEIKTIIITGSEKSFAAGADVNEMKDKTLSEVFANNFSEDWCDQARIKKPIIAACNGYTLGGGCEIAMMADIIYAGEKAVFGHPEIKLGVISGAGGTQRLPRYIGKAHGTEALLTGRTFSAKEALKWGLVANIFKPEELIDEVVKIASEISQFSPLVIKAAKEAINEGYNLPLDEGIKYERRLLHALFGTKDRKEGMTAFAEKRKANFIGE